MIRFWYRTDRWSLRRTTAHLFDFSVESVKEAGWQLKAVTYDLHHDEELVQGNVMTEYEERFSAKGNPIHKLIAVR